jgi:putative permease
MTDRFESNSGTSGHAERPSEQASEGDRTRAPDAVTGRPAAPRRHGLASTGPTDFSDRLVITEAKRAATWVAVVALAALVVVLSQPLLVIFGGIVFAALVDGGARLLGRVLHVGRSVRIGLVLFFAVSFLVWLVMFAGNQITDQAAQMPAVVNLQVHRLLDWGRAHGITFGKTDFGSVAQQAIGGVGSLTTVLGGLLGGVTTLFLILILGVYLAMEPRLYQRGVAWMLPLNERASFQVTLTRMGRSLRMLLFGRVLGMVVEGVAVGVLLALYGVPMAALLGILTCMLAFLPNIGAPISGALMILVGFSGGTNMGIYCAVVYVAVQTIDGYIIVPMVARRTADLAPALVLGAQLIMGVLFGLLGLVLADPIVLMLKIALERQSERNDQPERSGSAAAPEPS